MKKNIFITSLLLFIFNPIVAQSIYTFETENIPYEDLTGSISLSNGNSWDDPGYSIPIGFDFTISTHTFNTIYVVEWGAGGTLSSNPNDTGTLPIFIPIIQDIISLGNSSPISYKIEGTTGNQILKIEWIHFGFFDDSTNNDYMNMQLWLYEGSNIIEYRYGTSQINNPNESFEGETGPIIGLLTSYNLDTDTLEDNAYFISGDPTNPTLTVIEANQTNTIPAINGTIPSGTVYRFIPETLTTTDFKFPKTTIFPNPTSDLLTVTSPSEIENITIYNTLGKIISKQKKAPQINVSSLNKGIYIIEIKSKSGIDRHKFIKQ